MQKGCLEQSLPMHNERGPDALHPCSAPFGRLAPSQIDPVNLVDRFVRNETGRTLVRPSGAAPGMARINWGYFGHPVLRPLGHRFRDVQIRSRRICLIQSPVT